MLTLPDAILPVLHPFATLFRSPTWLKAQILLVSHGDAFGEGGTVGKSLAEADGSIAQTYSQTSEDSASDAELFFYRILLISDSTRPSDSRAASNCWVTSQPLRLRSFQVSLPLSE